MKQIQQKRPLKKGEPILYKKRQYWYLYTYQAEGNLGNLLMCEYDKMNKKTGELETLFIAIPENPGAVKKGPKLNKPTLKNARQTDIFDFLKEVTS